MGGGVGGGGEARLSDECEDEVDSVPRLITLPRSSSVPGDSPSSSAILLAGSTPLHLGSLKTSRKRSFLSLARSTHFSHFEKRGMLDVSIELMESKRSERTSREGEAK